LGQISSLETFRNTFWGLQANTGAPITILASVSYISLMAEVWNKTGVHPHNYIDLLAILWSAHRPPTNRTPARDRAYIMFYTMLLWDIPPGVLLFILSPSYTLVLVQTPTMNENNLTSWHGVFKQH
jgi:hypothetical protein